MGRILAALLAGLATLMALPAQAAAPAADVVTEGGRVALPPAGPQGVTVFKGLPYAAPPLGPGRWRPPAPAAPWRGLRDATRFSADCLQPASQRTGLPVSEDCLYLNIWTGGPGGAPRPVFVWIHGGGSRVGSGAQPQFDGTALARQGVVVVTINYRLGPMGFLSTPGLSAESGYGASGNYGFMDQIAALRWVRTNIAAFGGDPARVTVGGESSGSVSTSVLMASPLAKGLFRGAIGESGSALRVVQPGSMGTTDLASEEAKGAALMARLGAADLAQLRAAPAPAILAAAEALGVYFNRPVVDGHLLPATPWRVFEQGRQNDVPLLVGWNAEEGWVRGAAAPGPLKDRLAELYGPEAAAVAAHYPADPAQDSAAAIDAAGDNNIAYPTWKWGLAQATFGRRPVYIYEFEHAPPIPADPAALAAGRKVLGAYHGAEMVYVFDTLASEPTWAVSEEDRRIARQMSTYWANFIKTGDPSGPGLPPWPPYDIKGEPQRMRIGPETGAAPDRDYAKFLAIKAAHDRIDPPDPCRPALRPGR